MNHILNEIISRQHPAKNPSFVLEFIAFCVSVLFILLLTAVLTIAQAEAQNDFHNLCDMSIIQAALHNSP